MPDSPVFEAEIDLAGGSAQAVVKTDGWEIWLTFKGRTHTFSIESLSSEWVRELGEALVAAASHMEEISG